MPDPAQNPASVPASETKSKKKKNKKKKNATTPHSQAETQNTEGQQDSAVKTPVDQAESEESDPEAEDDTVPPQSTTSRATTADADPGSATNGVKPVTNEPDSDPTSRFDALVNDRDALRAEVVQLRQSLEELQSKHNAETESLQKDLEDSQGEREHAEEQYQNLLGKVNTIRSQLGQRLKEDAEELGQARTRIEELEEQKSGLQEQYTARSAEVEELQTRNSQQDQELNQLRSRSTLSQQNWVKEREELIESEAYIREEFENSKQAMHDWEVLAMEERQKRRDLAEAVADLEEQLTTFKSDHERLTAERDTQSSTVDGLQRAMREIQEARRKELREVVETSQSEIQALRKELDELRTGNEKLKTEHDEAKKELERALPFEKEVKEKNLLIGKLRHEAVILSEHLTKALRFLKKGKPEDNVDRQIVTNHFLHFLALDRSDPKKFQVLQLIAALLNWSDDQKVQAGLARPGASSSGVGLTGSLRLPSSPLVHRTPSTPSLMHSDYFANDSFRSPDQRESLAELWQNFLEQEATSGSRAPSVSSPTAGLGFGSGIDRSRVSSIAGSMAPTLANPTLPVIRPTPDSESTDTDGTSRRE